MGSGTASGAVGLPAIVFGPMQTAAQHQYVFGGGSGSGSPNAMTTTASTAIDVSIPETRDFYRGLLTPVSARTVAFFTAQGIPREILFYLFTDRLIETRRGVGTFVSARPHEAASRRDRDRQLRELADHFFAETGTRGFSIDDLIEHLHGRRKKVTQVDNLRSRR